MIVVPGAIAGSIVAVMVIVTVPRAGMLPFQVTVFVAIVATALPELAVAETRCSCDGRTSVSSLPLLSACVAGPLLDSVIVYVTVLPGVNVPLTLFVPETFDGEMTFVVAVADSLPLFGSVVADVIVAVAVMIVFGNVDAPTRTPSVKLLVPTANDAFVHVTMPVAPTAGVVHDQPATAGSESNVVFAGIGIVSDADVAAVGPAFVTAIA